MPFYRAVLLWSEADGLRMSAAMSFYGILSLAPMLVLLVAVLGWWIDADYVENNLVQQIAAVVGRQGADVVRQALDSTQQPAEGAVASLIAFGLLLSGATGVFAELQSSFERIWYSGKGPIPETPWWHTASLRLRGVAYILAFGFLLLVSLVITTALNVVSHWAGRWLPMEVLLRVLNELIAFGFATALFAALMRLSGGAKPSLRYLVMGGAVGALLFALGKHGLAYYLSTAAVVSAYGAAGSLVVLLMWIYFSSAILLFGAGCARAFADMADEQARRREERRQRQEALEAALARDGIARPDPGV
ncbi:MAG: YihY/virulence factor BrkB family protein [Xylophilus ampelinus]